MHIKVSSQTNVNPKLNYKKDDRFDIRKINNELDNVTKQ